jgi:hypothetical protein
MGGTTAVSRGGRYGWATSWRAAGGYEHISIIRVDRRRRREENGRKRGYLDAHQVDGWGKDGEAAVVGL